MQLVIHALTSILAKPLLKLGHEWAITLKNNGCGY